MNSKLLPSLQTQILRSVAIISAFLALIFAIVFTVVFSNFDQFQKAMEKKARFIDSSETIRQILNDVSQFENKEIPLEIHDLFNMEVTVLKSNAINEETLAEIEQIQKEWSLLLNTKGTRKGSIANITSYLKQLTDQNENIFINYTLNYINNQSDFLIGAIIVLILTIIITGVMSYKFLASAIAPLINLSETFSNIKSINHKLHLPKAHFSEVQNLHKSLRALWELLYLADTDKVQKIELKNLKLNTIINSIDDIVFFVDDEGKLAHANDAFYELVGTPVPKEDELLKNWESVIQPQAELYKKIKPYIDRQETVEREISLSSSNETYLLRARKVLNSREKYIGSLYLLQDIAQEAEERKLYKEFIAVLSHELKTPIQSLVTASELLHDFSIESDDNYKLLCNTIDEDVLKIRSIADDFVRFGQSEVNSLKLNEEKVDLYKEILSLCDSLRLITRDKKIDISVDKEKKQKYWASIDSTRFGWAISNLVLNAYRVSPVASKIEIKLRQDKDNIFIDIEDQGPGISKNDVKNIFKPFYQGEKKGKLGLGLSIAKEVIKAHDGSISYMPRKPLGSIFSIELPTIRKEGASVESISR